MAQVPYTSFYQGPFAVYTSPTGMASQVTGTPYLGGSLHAGDYCDLQANEAAEWNQRFGSNLYPGRYRFVSLSENATAADTGFGKVLGWGFPTSLAQVVITAAGTGSGSGSVSVSSTAAGGTAATALVTVSSGVITGVQLTFPGGGFTSLPTFGLTELTAAGITSSGTIAAQLNVSPNFVSTLDGTSNVGGSLFLPRAISLTPVTAAQITAGAWIVVQELGIAPALVTTAGATAGVGNMAYALTGGGVETATPAFNATTFGYALDFPATGELIRVNLTLPVLQG